MRKDSKIFVAGHRGMVGGAILRVLRDRGHKNAFGMAKNELDLRDQKGVAEFFEREKPEYVFLAAAKVGGILANATYPAEFIHDNLAIQTNVIHSAWKNGCKKLLFLGSSCIYPKFAPQPISEDALLTGALEPTNDAYALAKIAGLQMAKAYRKQYGFDAICAMPTNLYGPGDNFHPENSHVAPALMRRFHEAKLANAPRVSIWGSGEALREFMHVDDLADACVFLMENYSDDSPVNVGSGEEVSVMELAKLIAEIVDYKGEIVFDISKPDGTPRKALNSGKLFSSGWRPSIKLREGLSKVYEWFISQDSYRGQ